MVYRDGINDFDVLHRFEPKIVAAAEPEAVMVRI